MRTAAPLLLSFLLLIVIVACEQSPCVGPDKDACLLQAAQERNESRLCADISAESIRTWCYTDIALKLQDTSICANTANERSTAFCVANIAVAKDDARLCSAISVDTARDKCLFEIGKSAKNATLCGNITQQSYGDGCVYDIAMDSSKPDDCGLIREGALANKCFMIVAARLNDSTVCARASGDYKDWCIANVAIKTGNMTLCEQIPPGDIKAGCVFGIKK